MISTLSEREIIISATLILSSANVLSPGKELTKSQLNKRYHWRWWIPVPIASCQEIVLDSPKLKEFADDNFKFDENGKKLSKRVENTVGKGEIARYEQFLLFPQCFQKACFPGASKSVIVWEWVNNYYKCIPVIANKFFYDISLKQGH